MRTIFRLTLAVSVLAFVGGCHQMFRVTAHDHSGDRYRTLHGLEDAVYVGEHRNSLFGLTPDELAKLDEPVARAYRESVDAAYKMGAGYDTRHSAYNILAMMLFSTSLLGLRALAPAPFNEHP